MNESSRRAFLASSASCAAHIAVAAAFAPAAVRRLWAQPMGNRPPAPVVAREPFGRLEQVADGIWALISTPLSGDRTTLSNGGIIAGRSGVLAVEGFMTPEGARWLATRARELTGRWPTHAVLTHYHADHANGVAGYMGEGSPAVHSTPETRSAVLEKNQPADQARSAALANVTMVEAGSGTTLDLGGRRVSLVRRRGHTASDVSIEVEEPSVVFTGDLIWNAMFPNYVDAIPSALSASVKALRRSRATTYVPGHGSVANEADVGRYLSLLDEVEGAARASHGRGTPAAEAGAAFAVPPALGEWLLFNKVFFERAFAAWYRELGAAPSPAAR